ncbi:MAG: DGQHR domain-containing protein [Methanoregulaceae archaeon]|nr:DGQHR domain-containing protein [Methanoregulaceae archaeon]
MASRTEGTESLFAATSSYAFPFRVQVLEVVQPLGQFYAAVLPADLLLKTTYSDPLTVMRIASDGQYDLRGHQRTLTKKRLQEIGRFIDTVEAAFPNSIILAANYNAEGELLEDDNDRWYVEYAPDGRIELVIPTAKKVAAVVDGQHRLYGFKEAGVEGRSGMPLLCAVYLDLPNPFQAFLFASINYNQKPVSKSQSYENYGYNLEKEPEDSWSPEKVAVFLCRKLNTDPVSPLAGHIIIAAQTDPSLQHVAEAIKKTWAVSTATVVEGLLRLFSTNPKRDRDLMHQKPADEGRKRLLLEKEPDSSPLRQYYLNTNDLLIYTMVLNYFKAVSKLMWSTSEQTFIQRTIGIQALFDLLREIAPSSLAAKDVSQQYFEKLLEPLRSLSFTDDFYHASGGGRVRVRKTMFFKLGLIESSELGPDAETYLRLTGVERT